MRILEERARFCPVAAALLQSKRMNDWSLGETEARAVEIYSRLYDEGKSAIAKMHEYGLGTQPMKVILNAGGAELASAEELQKLRGLLREAADTISALVFEGPNADRSQARELVAKLDAASRSVP